MPISILKILRILSKKPILHSSWTLAVTIDNTVQIVEN